MARADTYIKIVRLLAPCLLMVGCLRVYPENRSSAEFPTVPSRDWPADSIPDPAVRQEIIVNDAFDKRRFRLEVKWSGGDGAGVRAYINLDGAEHAMTRSGSYLWTFDDEPPRCVSQYRYWYRATYGSDTKTIGSPTEPLVAPVSNWGQVSWYPYAGGASTTNGDVFIYSSSSREARISVQNLTQQSATLVRVVARNDPDCPKFQLLDVPATPHTMPACGNVPFRVKWTPQAGDDSDVCQFDVNVAQSVPGTGNAQSLLDVTIRVVGTATQ